MPQKKEADNCQNEKVFLFFSYAWSQAKEGMALVNRSLALSLVRFKNVKVYCTVLQPEKEVEPSQIQDAKDNGITLIFADHFPQLKSKVPHVTYIIAHSPLMIDAVQEMRTQLYPDSKLILFYHVIPSDVHPFTKALPLMPASEEDLIQDAESADVVYSVTERVFNYFEPRFRNRASVHINHKVYHPQCPKEFFSMSNKPFPATGPFKMLIQTTSEGIGQWNGLDIASWCGAKLAQTASTSSSCRSPELTVGGIFENKKAATKELLADVTSSQQPSRSLNDDDDEGASKAVQLKTDVHHQKNAGELINDFSQHALCLLPTRAEPFGVSGLQALSAGIPTLLSDDCFLAPVVRKLSTEPDYFLVPVTKDTAAARQDGSAWKDRVLGIMQNPQKAYEMAYQLKMALKRDEPTKVSHDSFIWHCLGGIALKHELKTLELKFYEDDEKELQIRKSFNAFLLNLLKQCWRLKHDPLTTEADLFSLVPDVQLPVRELIREVTDRIEEFDRCIVAADDSTGAFIVYCPTADSLSDLWAMCDRINGALTRTLLALPEPNPILDHFRLRSATFRTVIDGSEFLKLKQSILMSKANNANDE